MPLPLFTCSFDPLPTGWDAIHPSMPNKFQKLRGQVALVMGVSYWEAGELFRRITEVRRTREKKP